MTDFKLSQEEAKQTALRLEQAIQRALYNIPNDARASFVIGFVVGYLRAQFTEEQVRIAVQAWVDTVMHSAAKKETPS